MNVIPIHLPSLRERKADIPSLVEFLLDRFAAKGKGSATTVSPQTLAILMDHQWPGNVRELENVLEHAMVCSRASVIEPDALPRSLVNGRAAPTPNTSRSGQHRGSTPRAVAASEKETILRVLESSRWNRGLAAAHLGIDRTTLWRKMQRFRISPPSR